MAKRKTTKKAATKRAQKNAANNQLLSVIWFAIAIFLLCVVFIKGENVWSALHNFMFGIFGVTAYFYPFLFFILVYYVYNSQDLAYLNF